MEPANPTINSRPPRVGALEAKLQGSRANPTRKADNFKVP